MVFFGSDAFDPWSGAGVSPSMKVVGNFIDRFKPFIVFLQNELGLCDLTPNGKPSVSDVIVGAK